MASLGSWIDIYHFADWQIKMILTSESLQSQFNKRTMVKPSHIPQERSNGWMVCVCYFDVIHKAVKDASKRILHSRGAKKMLSVADGGKQCNSPVNSIGTHDPAIFPRLEWQW
jgi:hypothetical protein